MFSDDVSTDGKEVVEDAQMRTTTRGTVDPRYKDLYEVLQVLKVASSTLDVPHHQLLIRGVLAEIAVMLDDPLDHIEVHLPGLLAREAFLSERGKKHAYVHGWRQWKRLLEWNCKQ